MSGWDELTAEFETQSLERVRKLHERFKAGEKTWIHLPAMSEWCRRWPVEIVEVTEYGSIIVRSLPHVPYGSKDRQVFAVEPVAVDDRLLE